MAWLEHSLDGIHACSSGLMQVTHDTSHSAGCDRATRLCVGLPLPLPTPYHLLPVCSVPALLLLLLCNHGPHILHVLLCCCQLSLSARQPVAVIRLHCCWGFVGIPRHGHLLAQCLDAACRLTRLLLQLGQLKGGVQDALEVVDKGGG